MNYIASEKCFTKQLDILYIFYTNRVNGVVQILKFAKLPFFIQTAQTDIFDAIF